MRNGLLAIAPWLVGWTGELEGACRPCPYAGGKLATWSISAPGSGKPLFKSLHPVRLRQCIVEKLCGVCGEPTTSDDRWMLNRGDWTRQPAGELRFLLRDFLLHSECCNFALANCPWLRGQPHQRVRAPNDFKLIATSKRMHLKGSGEQPDYDGPVVDRLWLTISPAEAVRRFGKLIPNPPGLTRHERRLLRHG